MQADSVSRRDLFKNLAAFGLAAAPLAANALVEYEGVPYLGGSDVIDINNANVRVYTKFPGLYPNIAKQIVKNVPYNSVDELFNLKGLSSEQKAVLKKYEKNFVALKPLPEVFHKNKKQLRFHMTMFGGSMFSTTSTTACTGKRRIVAVVLLNLIQTKGPMLRCGLSPLSLVSAISWDRCLSLCLAAWLNTA